MQRAESELAAATAAHASAERAVADTSIRAPFDGIAELVHVQEGDYLNPGMSVATIVDFSRARIRAGVTAREATLLAGTTTAELALEALGGDLISGKVHSVARIADAATGTFAVEIWLDNATHLREGMLATVYMPYQAREARPTVPTAAIFRRNGTPHVFTVTDNRARLKAVRIGRSNGSVVEVVEGLAKGESVVIDGQFALRDGAIVAIVGRDI